MRKLRHSTKEMKAVAEEKRRELETPYFQGGDGGRLMLQAVSVSMSSVSLQERIVTGTLLL